MQDRSIILDDSYELDTKRVIFNALKAIERIDIKEGKDDESIDVYVDKKIVFFTSTYKLRTVYTDKTDCPQYYVAMLIDLCEKAVHEEIVSITLMKVKNGTLKIRVTVNN